MTSPISYCPHCGEDVRLAANQAAAENAPPTQERAVVKREVTSAEVERLWGLMPLPFQIRPFGVVVDQGNNPLAIAGEDGEGALWEMAAGETRMLNTAAPPPAPAPEPEAAPPAAPMEAARPNTVPDHICNTNARALKEQVGRQRYGS